MNIKSDARGTTKAEAGDLVRKFRVYSEVYPESAFVKHELRKIGFSLQLFGTHEHATEDVSPSCDLCRAVQAALKTIIRSIPALCVLSLMLSPLALRAQSTAAITTVDEWRMGFNQQLDDEIGELVSARRSEAVSPAQRKLDIPTYKATQPRPSTISSILVAQGLPANLLAVAAVESGFNPAAVSPKGAAGLWQFMPSTARQYGLVVSATQDDRFDIVKSTVAAAHYLRQLHDQFGDWPLALAAYNAGPTRLSHGIRRFNSVDFWTLSRHASLPSETLAYVPNVLDLMRSGVAENDIELQPDTYPVRSHRSSNFRFTRLNHNGNLVFATESPDAPTPRPEK